MSERVGLYTSMDVLLYTMFHKMIHRSSALIVVQTSRTAARIVFTSLSVGTESRYMEDLTVYIGEVLGVPVTWTNGIPAIKTGRGGIAFPGKLEDLIDARIRELADEYTANLDRRHEPDDVARYKECVFAALSNKVPAYHFS